MPRSGLESLGFTRVYDFVPGKAAWLAMGLPREGRSAGVPNAGEVADRDVPTCLLSDGVGDVRQRVGEQHLCVVLNAQGVVAGRLRSDAYRRDPESKAEDVMEPGVTTVRPSEPLEPLVERGRWRGELRESVLAAAPEAPSRSRVVIHPGPSGRGALSGRCAGWVREWAPLAGPRSGEREPVRGSP